MNNYRIVAPHGFPHSCWCESSYLEQNDLPPPESFPTLEAAIERIPKLFAEVAPLAFPKGLQIPEGSVTVQTLFYYDMLDEEFTSADAGQITDRFRQHPSVDMAGLVRFWNTDHAVIHCLLQGDAEIKAYLESPEGREAAELAESIGATAIKVGGIHVRPRKKR